MPIIYSLVARGTCVLAEHTTTSGNFTTVTRRILEKIPLDMETKMSYVYDKHVFHYAVQDGLVFLCMADEDFGRRVPFAFIDDVKTRWFNTYGERGASALAYGARGPSAAYRPGGHGLSIARRARGAAPGTQA